MGYVPQRNNTTLADLNSVQPAQRSDQRSKNQFYAPLNDQQPPKIEAKTRIQSIIIPFLHIYMYFLCMHLCVTGIMNTLVVDP